MDSKSSGNITSEAFPPVSGKEERSILLDGDTLMFSLAILPTSIDWPSANLADVVDLRNGLG
jgi:hypothetical protein